MSNAVTLNGVPAPSFLKVNEIKYPVLPTVNHYTQDVYGRDGEYDFGSRMGMRKIEVTFQIIADDELDIMKKARDFANWLYHKDLVPLVFDDEPDKQYMVRVVEDSDLAEEFRVGRTTITFIAPQPHAESIDEHTLSVTPTDDTPFNLLNNGTSTAYPVYEVTLNQDTSSLALVGDDDFLLLGSQETIEKSAIVKDPRVLYDNMKTFSGWTTATSIPDGEVYGTFEATGNDGIKQKDNDFGIKPYWHGASAVKPLSIPVQDFYVNTHMGWGGNRTGTVARCVWYLIDENGLYLGEFGVTGTQLKGKNSPRFFLNLGSGSNKKTIFSLTPSKTRKWENFDIGVMRIKRIGQNWELYIGVLQADGKNKGKILYPYTVKWRDTKNKYSAKLAKIQIHLGKYSTRPTPPRFYLSHLEVKALGEYDAETQVPIEMLQDDVIRIDMERAVVTKNGFPMYNLMDPASSFFGLSPGVNGIILTPQVGTVNVTWKDRWL